MYWCPSRGKEAQVVLQKGGMTLWIDRPFPAEEATNVGRLSSPIDGVLWCRVTDGQVRFLYLPTRLPPPGWTGTVHCVDGAVEGVLSVAVVPGTECWGAVIPP
jgi:hypothetical protein